MKTIMKLIKKKLLKREGVNKMKKVVKIAGIGALAVILCILPFVRNVAGDVPEPPTLEGTNLIRHYEYNEGCIVGIYDAVNDYQTIFSAGKMVRMVHADDEDIVVTDYHYENGSLQYGENMQTGDKIYYDGDISKPMYEKNKEGFVTAEYVYNSSGFLVRKDLFDKINDERAKVGYIEYKNGLQTTAYELKDPENADSEMVVTGEFHYDGRDLKSVTSHGWVRNEEGDFEEKITTTFYKDGRPDRVENNEGATVMKWNYDGTKLVSMENLGENGAYSRTYVDKHGRQVVRYDVENDVETRIAESWHYNDTAEGIDVSYKVDDEERTVHVAPGDLVKSVVFCEYDEASFEDVTYYNYNKAQDTVMESYNLADLSNPQKHYSDPVNRGRISTRGSHIVFITDHELALNSPGYDANKDGRVDRESVLTTQDKDGNYVYVLADNNDGNRELYKKFLSIASDNDSTNDEITIQWSYFTENYEENSDGYGWLWVDKIVS